MAVLFCIPDPKKTWGKALCCCPLAAVVIVISIIFLLYGTSDVYSAASSSFFPDFGTIVTLIMGILIILVGILGILAVAIQLKAGAGALYVVMKVFLVIAIVRFIVNWVLLIYELSANNYKPDSTAITFIVLLNVFYIFYFCSAWWIFSVLGSFKEVMEAGGTGWEKKNAEDVRTDLAAGKLVDAESPKEPTYVKEV
eukprot:GHVP01067512.1.p1 GENE.GHVP01067512.1~~GHVP01067512.1.p1  ORF type:complete len:197 (+),score=26.62 GHVP01067512.1:53-643(+)